MLASKWVLSLLMAGTHKYKTEWSSYKVSVQVKASTLFIVDERGPPVRTAPLHQSWHEPSQHAIFLTTEHCFFLSSIWEFSLRVYLLLIRHGLCSRKLSLHRTENLFGIWMGFLAIFSSSFQSLFPANFSSRTKVSTDRNRKWPFMSSPEKSAVNSPEVESKHSQDES